ncbi:MAG: ribose 5-phosphate isomerase B [Alphaproteobacteria bacterium]|nr:ribose 5-phosphate isomerase B [Alphaproteobacteria bacterium]
MKVAIACDHGGVGLKGYLKDNIEAEWLDLGTDGTDSVDYPDFGYKLAEAVADGEVEFGIAICGSGIGISMACNRHPKIRAAVCTNTTMARLTRIDNNANILCLGARLTGEILAKDIVEEFLKTPFEAGGRHARRVNKLDKVF